MCRPARMSYSYFAGEWVRCEPGTINLSSTRSSGQQFKPHRTIGFCLTRNKQVENKVRRCCMTYSVLGIDTQTGQRVKIHKSLRLQGFAIIGLQGTGKTVLIKNLIIQDIKQYISLCVLDL